MSIENNNGMFEKIKKSMERGHSIDPIGLELDLTADTTKQDMQNILEQELIKRLSKEKHRLAAEMEIKFKEAGVKRMQAQEKKLKELVSKHKQTFKETLANEKQAYEKNLKDKYNRVMKSMLQEREQKIADEYKNQYYSTDVELRNQIEKLKQESFQQQQIVTLQIAEAKIAAKQEQEQASRVLYDNILEAKRAETIKQTEEKLRSDFLRIEINLNREHEINLKKHTAKLMSAYEEKLRDALFDQEQVFARTSNEQLTRQSELFNHRIQQEVDSAVSSATSKLELEFVKEKQTLNSIIENMRPEIEANRLRMRFDVEKEIREEFEVKFAQYKQKVDQAKQLELETLVTEQKQKIAEAMQEENMVVLKYKEREIRENCNAELQRDLQSKIHENLVEQEKRLRTEHQQQIEQTTQKLQTDHAIQLQAEVIQERARVAEKSTSEKKILLQQQQANLQEQFAGELAHKLAMQAQTLAQQYQVEIRNLETRLQTLQNQQSIKNAHQQAVAITQRPSEPQFERLNEVDEPFLVSADTVVEPPKFDASIYENEKKAALRAQEQSLRAEFEQKLYMIRAEWEQEHRGIEHRTHEEELLACEQKLRREFQAILEQQRMQAATNFAKQRDVELRATVAKYKQKILNEMEIVRINDLAAAEEALKEQYSVRMQQHGELARVEIERTKDRLLTEQAEKIKAAVDLQLDAVRKDQDRKFAAYAQNQDEKLKVIIEEERQKLNVKFAQDKANLIKDLTAKFTREKHIAMNKYETELREKLYKEMVKQKDFIQAKFTQTQEMALQEQKRRLEAQHKHEAERIKQGFFDPVIDSPKHDEFIADRNVELLADKILAKFQK